VGVLPKSPMESGFLA